MKRSLRTFVLKAAACLAVTLQTSQGVAQGKAIDPPKSNPKADQLIREAPVQDAYILGPGDAVLIELLDIPEYSGIFNIGPDGTLYVPRLRSLTVEGLTVEELRYLLTQKFNKYVHEPQVFVTPVAYRPIRVYIGGEVLRPGYYDLTQTQSIQSLVSIREENSRYKQYPTAAENGEPKTGLSLRLPTVFDAIRTAGGVTPFSKLDDVTVTRKLSIGSGGGKKRTTLNFLSLLTEGNETQNIRLYDGDSVIISRSPIELRDQIIKASQTNLSSDVISVFITGRVRDPGRKVLPQGASLNQAIASAGGTKLLHGRVEFIRFNRDGSTIHRKFSSNDAESAGSYKNPILMSGDVVRVSDSPVSATANVLNEITAPAIGIYSVFNLLETFK